MKKTISIILAIMMVATLSVSVFAAGEIKAADGFSEQEVKGTFVAAETPDTYVVDVTWGAMEFTYTQASQTWNDEEGKWEDAAADNAGAWAVDATGGDKVTVKNRSSVSITASYTYTAAETKGVAGAFDKTTSGTLVFNGEDVATLTLTAKPDVTIEEGAVVGTAKVTIAKVAA